MLTSYNGTAVEFDGSGNLYFDGAWYYTWEHGHQLSAMISEDWETEWTFSYNADGLRTKRTNGAKTYTYLYNNGLLTQMTVGGNTLRFAYDAVGAPLTVTLNGTVYFYVTNLQGDVIGIRTVDGAEIVGYTYDAWGNVLHVSGTHALATLNPLRYRGYIYDTETCLYYLQSRYYNPTWGRFISADAYLSTGQGILGHNMFAYCGNNPINRVDPSGAFWLELLFVAVVIIVGGSSLSSCTSPQTAGTGAATSYTPSDSMDYNCYAYALGENEWKYVGGESGTVVDFNVDVVAEMVLNDAAKDGRSMRIIDTYDSPISTNEYRIALRTGEEDYHFMVQHNNGSWSHKPGICSTRLIEGANPSVVSWDRPRIDPILLYNYGVVKEVGYQHNYYDSRTIYFAVSK